MGLLEFKKVSKKFGDVKALDQVTFEVDDGELVFIMGESGAGKTTLLKVLLKEISPSDGDVILDGKKLSEVKKKYIPKLRQQIGSIFQDFKLLEDRKISENLELALAVKSVEQKKWKARIDHVLGLVGLSDKSEMFPRQLSGGELQRAAIARALVINPKIIFADEPTGNLDWDTSESIIMLLDKINTEGKTIIITTHNKALVDKLGKRVIMMQKGKVISDSKATKKAK